VIELAMVIQDGHGPKRTPTHCSESHSGPGSHRSYSALAFLPLVVPPDRRLRNPSVIPADAPYGPGNKKDCKVTPDPKGGEDTNLCIVSRVLRSRGIEEGHQEQAIPKDKNQEQQVPQCQ
jgi:hypothetical protein